MTFDFGYNVWIEEANIDYVKRNLRLAFKSIDPSIAAEYVLKDSIGDGLISGYKISIQKNSFVPSRLKIDLISNSGKIYSWYN